MKRVIFAAIALSILSVTGTKSFVAPAEITWVKQTNPGGTPNFVAFTSFVHDPTSGQILAYVTPSTSSGIFSTTLYGYNLATNVWTRVGGTDSPTSSCNDGSASDVLPWPGDRHPIQHWARDTTRNIVWLAGGVCNGTLRDDLWSLALNATITSDTWTSYGTVTMPDLGSNMVYSPDDDVLVSYGMVDSGNGFGELWIYCPNAGSLTSQQTAAGCVSANLWTKILGPALNPTMPDYAYGYFNTMFYDTGLNKVVLFAKDNASGTHEVWQYDVPTKTFTEQTVTATPSDTASSSAEQDHTYITSGTYVGTYFYHKPQRLGTSCTTGDTTAGYTFNSTTNTYAAITVNGIGPRCLVYIQWDATNNKVFGWNYAVPGGTNPEVWIGTFTGESEPEPPVTAAKARVLLRIR